MTTEKFLNFLMTYNAALVESLVVLVLLTAAFLSFRSFRQSKAEQTGEGYAPDLSHLEATLQKLLERANQMPTNAALAHSVASGATDGSTEAQKLGGEASALLPQIAALKAELEQKQLEIQGFQSTTTGAGATASPGVSSDEKAIFETQIKDLQRKLEEFDIISADIADLSFYKEENLRLQKELSEAKVAPAGAPAEKSVEPVAAAPTPAPVVKAAPAQVTEVNAPAPEPLPEVSATSANEAAIQDVVDEDLIKEYAAMVDAQRTAAQAKTTEMLDPITGKAVSLSNVPGMPEINIPAIGEKPGSAVDSQTSEVLSQFEDFAKKENKE